MWATLLIFMATTLRFLSGMLELIDPAMRAYEIEPFSG